MKRVFRVFIEHGEVGEEADLRPDDARHLSRVLRLQTGTPVQGFDGRGGIYHGVITHLEHDGGRIRVEKIGREPPPAGPFITLAMALVRTEPMETAIQKATELGCHRFLPLISRYVSRKQAFLYVQSRLPRWERISRESLKQCRRNTRLVIMPSMKAIPFFKTEWSGSKLLLHPNAATSLKTFLEKTEERPSHLMISIGPEGGWSEVEENLALENGFKRFTLGPTILKAETAAITTLSIIMNHYFW